MAAANGRGNSCRQRKECGNMNEAEKQKPGLNRNQIKYILILAMVVDHIAWGFVEKASFNGQWMHFIGRLTGPGMAFFLVEGYHHTRNIKSYILRLGIFAVISWPAYAYFEKGSILHPSFGVIYTLFLSLLLLVVYDRTDLTVIQKEWSMMVLMGLSLFGDWPGFDPAYALCFHVFRNNKKMMWGVYSAISLLSFSFNGFCREGLFQTGVFLVPLLLLTYNGRPGSRSAFHKWFFYIFYPLHLAVLGYFRWR